MPAILQSLSRHFVAFVTRRWMCFGVENPFFERQVIPGTEEQPEIFECFCQPEALLCVVVLYNLVGHILSNPNACPGQVLALMWTSSKTYMERVCKMRSE